MKSHIFNIQTAVDFSIEKAILIANIDFWLVYNKANNKNIHENKVWTYNSRKSFHELFPYIQEQKIGRIMRELENIDGVLISSNKYNKLNIDKTKWYTFTDSFLNKYGNTLSYIAPGCSSKNAPLLQNEQALPVINNTTVAITSLPKDNMPTYCIENLSVDKISKNDSLIHGSEKEIFDTHSIDNIKETIPENNIINYWNSFDCFITHKSRNTNTYKRCVNILNKLKEGIFHTEIELDKNWYIDNKIKNIFKNPMTEKHIIKLITKYSKQFDNMYQPENKKLLVRGLLDFIYNTRTQKSQLLYIACHDLKTVGNIDPQIIKKRIPKDVLRGVENIIMYKTPNMSDKRRLQVYIGVEAILKTMNDIVTVLKPILCTNSSFVAYIANKQMFVKQWLEHIEGFKEIQSNTFGTSGWVWKSFIEKMENTHNLNLDVDQKVKRVRKPVKTVVEKEPEVVIDTTGDLMSQLYS